MREQALPDHRRSRDDPCSIFSDQTKEANGTTVTLSPDIVERCKDFARNITNHYRNNGDCITAMPWTRDQLSDDELRQWLASRKEAASKIDIATCEIGRWYANDGGDEYGIKVMLGEQPNEQTGRWLFVRSPDSDGWVSEGDLSNEQAHALYDRINKQTKEN